jgi:hypothetical protein
VEGKNGEITVVAGSKEDLEEEDNEGGRLRRMTVRESGEYCLDTLAWS